MRCSRCRKEIPGIGKSALPPVVPVLVAFAGSILGLFNLTLGQDPANALPHWSPATGWTLALGSLAVASALGWVSLVRRKCPECGCTRMLDPMEEESVTALERAAAVRAAVDEARLEWQGHGTSAAAPAVASAAQTPAAPAPAPAASPAAQTQETADRFATLEKQLREELERRVRESAEHERLLRKKLDEERAQLESRLRSEIEKQVHANLEKPAEPVLAPPVSKPMTPSPVTVSKPMTPSPVTVSKPVTPSPVTVAKALATSPATTARPMTPSPVTLGKPATTAKPMTPSPVSVARPVTPSPVSVAKALSTSPAPATAAKPVTPSPVTVGKAIASSPSPSTTPTPVTAASKKTAQPAAALPKVETAPLALMASVGRAEVRSPAAVSAPAPQTPQTTPADGHERAKRRARVILSDLIAYHRDELVKAAHAEDPRKELGTLWRDAVTSYNEAAAPEIRGVTNYLEDELSKQLADLRQS